jgi:hypothetical protein
MMNRVRAWWEAQAQRRQRRITIWAAVMAPLFILMLAFGAYTTVVFTAVAIAAIVGVGEWMTTRQRRHDG